MRIFDVSIDLRLLEVGAVLFGGFRAEYYLDEHVDCDASAHQEHRSAQLSRAGA